MNLYRTKSSAFCKLIRQSSTIENTPRLIKYGQPTSQSHPHLIKPGEVLPYIQTTEFQTRRQNLIALLYDYNFDDTRSNIVVIPAATKKYMSERIPYVFRQNSDYLYLSGCLEPDSCLVLNTKPNSINHISTLFVRNYDPHLELWDGPRTSANTAPELFGVDKSLPMAELPSFLVSLALESKNVYIWCDLSNAVQPTISKIIDAVCEKLPNINIESPRRFIHKLRLIKSPAEILLMKMSCEIASNAIHKAMATSKPDITEHQLFATVDYECRMKGAAYLAYPPVVAGGNRATTIHYINNNQVISDGEMVLMDAGCDYHGYSSDITRTWPINGRFTPQQKLIYQVIRDVQYELLKMVMRFPTLDDLFEHMCLLLGKRLQEIGLISSKASKQEILKASYQFCPHHVSHYLGMDVHDTESVQRNIPLQPGMVITVEPGIYISEKTGVPKEYQGLGIRIEDDVLITVDGPAVLSENCIKEISQIENTIR